MRRLLEYLTGARAITLPDEDADTLSRVLARAAAVGSAEAARVFCESLKDDHANADSDDEPLPPTGAAAAAPAPAALTCLTANSPAELAALRARYTAVRDRLEAEGAARRRADPSNADILLIEDDMGDGDELDGAEYSAAEAGVATGAGEPSPDPELLQQQRRAAAQVRKRAQVLAKHIDKSREALDEFSLTGVGAHMARLRSAAVAAQASASGADGAPAAGGVSAAVPPESAASGASRASVAPLLPFGPGPHCLTVRLVRPRVDPEAHEIYTRFNMSIHHSRPGDNRREAYERHLVKSPLMPTPAHDLGFEYWCSLRSEGVDETLPPGSTVTPEPADKQRAAAFEAVAAELDEPALRPSDEASALLRAWAITSPEASWFIAAYKRRAARRAVGAAAAAAGGAGAPPPLSFDPMPALPAALLPVLGVLRGTASDLGLSVEANVAALLGEADRLLEDGRRRISRRHAQQLSADMRLAQRLAMSDGEDEDSIISSFEEEEAAMDGSDPAWLSADVLYSRALESALAAGEDNAWQWDKVTQRLRTVREMVLTYGPAGRHSVADDEPPVPAPPAPLPGLAVFDALKPAPAHAASAAAPVAAAAASDLVVVEGWDLSMGFGTFHHEYRINGILLAVSVLDILPTRVASVYFFYNPDFRYLQLGKLSALVEVWLTRRIFEHTRTHPEVLGLPPGVGSLLRYWDANFYCHHATTMNYKRHFHPSSVLLHGQWRAITPALLVALDEQPAGPPALPEEDEGFAPPPDLSQVAVLSRRADPPFPLGLLAPQTVARLESGLRRFVRAIGPSLVLRCVVDINVLWNIAARAGELRSAQALRALIQQAEAAAAAAASHESHDAAAADGGHGAGHR